MGGSEGLCMGVVMGSGRECVAICGSGDGE